MGRNGSKTDFNEPKSPVSPLSGETIPEATQFPGSASPLLQSGPSVATALALVAAADAASNPRSPVRGPGLLNGHASAEKLSLGGREPETPGSDAGDQEEKRALKPLEVDSKILEQLKPQPHDTLLVVDMQVDFISGALTVAGKRLEENIPGAECLLPFINELIKQFKEAGALVVYTQDYHPADHQSFASQHEGKKPFEYFDLGYGKQQLWPDHCVQGEAGSLLHEDLLLIDKGLVLRKGFRRRVDSFSAFCDNDKVSTTGLREEINNWHTQPLQAVGKAKEQPKELSEEQAAGAMITIDRSRTYKSSPPAADEPPHRVGTLEIPGTDKKRLFIVGLAYDVVVMYSALEAASLVRAEKQRVETEKKMEEETAKVRGLRRQKKDTCTTRDIQGNEKSVADVEAEVDDDTKRRRLQREKDKVWWEKVIVLEDGTRTIHDDKKTYEMTRRKLKEVAEEITVVDEGYLVAIPDELVNVKRMRDEPRPPPLKAEDPGKLLTLTVKVGADGQLQVVKQSQPT